MRELADQYAKAHNTKVIAFADYETYCVFVLESGKKLTITKAELEAEASNKTPAISAENTPPPAEKSRQGGTKKGKA